MITITFDDKKCPSPRECLRCLHACPQGVFTNYPRDTAPGKPAGNWVVLPTFLSRCAGCQICEDVCPEKALTVTIQDTGGNA